MQFDEESYLNKKKDSKESNNDSPAIDKQDKADEHDEQSSANASTSEMLNQVVNRYDDDKISLYQIMYALHERGFGILLAFFTLPTSVPALVPPVTTIISIPLLFFSLQMILCLKSPWLPKRLGNWRISRRSLSLLMSKSAKLLRKIELFMRPRMTFASSQKGERIIGVFCFIFALSIAIPLPMTNLLPSIGILVTSLGLLGRDGLLVIIGMTIGTIGSLIAWALTIMILYYGFDALDMIKDYVGGIFGFDSEDIEIIADITDDDGDNGGEDGEQKG